MAKKPDAARGKTTRKGKIKKIVKKFLGTGRPISKPSTMSPGAMGGRSAPRRGLKRTPESRTRTAQGILGRAAAKTLRGAGASGIGMAGQAMKLAKKLKPSGRLNIDDLKKAKQMMMKRKGK